MQTRRLTLAMGLALSLAVAMFAQEVTRTPAYQYRNEGVKVFFEIAGVKLLPMAGMAYPPLFTPDRSHWLAVTRLFEPERAVEVQLDGKGQGAVPRIGRVSMACLSPDGTRWAMAGQRAEPGPSAWDVVGPSGSSGPWRDVTGLAFDPTGTSLAFAARKDDGDWVVVDGKASGPFSEAGLICRPDGAWIGTWNRGKDNQYRLRLGAKELGPYSLVNPAMDWFSADGSRYLARAYRNGVSYLIDSGKETRLDALNLVLPASGGVWYSWGKGGGWMYAVNGTTVGPYDMPPVGWGGGGPFFIAGGTRWAISHLAPRAGRYDTMLVKLSGLKDEVPGWNLSAVRDARGEAFTWHEGGWESDLVFSRSDGENIESRTLYRVERTAGGWSIAWQGKTIGTWEELYRPAVTADGRHWVAAGRTADRRWEPIVDGVVGSASRPAIGLDRLAISPDGSRWQMTAVSALKPRQEWLMTDGGETGPFVSAPMLRWSSDGRHSQGWASAKLAGEKVFLADGKRYGPWPGSRGSDPQLYDLEHGRFLVSEKGKDGWTLHTAEGSWGPYQNYEPLSYGPRERDSSEGALWGFLATKKDGSQELRVLSGFTGGGASYAVAQRAWPGIDASGASWWMPLPPQPGGKQLLLHNGAPVECDGYDLRRTPDGFGLILVQGNEVTVIDGAKEQRLTGQLAAWRTIADGMVRAVEVQGNGPGALGTVVINGTAYPGYGLGWQAIGLRERLWWIEEKDGTGTVASVMAGRP